MFTFTSTGVSYVTSGMVCLFRHCLLYSSRSSVKRGNSAVARTERYYRMMDEATALPQYKYNTVERRP